MSITIPYIEPCVCHFFFKTEDSTWHTMGRLMEVNVETFSPYSEVDGDVTVYLHDIHREPVEIDLDTRFSRREIKKLAKVLGMSRTSLLFPKKKKRAEKRMRRKLRRNKS